MKKKKKEIEYKPTYNGLSFSKYHKPTKVQEQTKEVLKLMAKKIFN